MKSIKLSQWAKDHGYSYKGAFLAFKRGGIPGAYQLSTGTILVQLEEPIIPEPVKPDKTVIYARVSTSKQKPDLASQVSRLTDFCIANGWSIDQVYQEVGSGLNDDRQKLNKLMEQNDITRIVVEHKDRLTRFGFHYLEHLFKNKGTEIIVVNKAANDQEDLMQDFVSVITSMAARVYGLRKSRRHTEEIIQNLKNNPL